MNVLFVGNYRDGTGWSHAAIEYIRAMDAVGIRLACRPISLSGTGTTSPIPDRVAEQVRVSYAHYDVVVQNVLPHHLDFSGAFDRNIALYYTETSNLGRTRWADHINCMDTAWVSCRQSRKASRSSNVTIPIKVVPIPCDTARYEQSYKMLPFRSHLSDNFIFYTIGEFNRRKNFRALLTAFHLEFDLNEPVALVIKTTPKAGESPWDAQQVIRSFCESIKQGLKLYDRVEHYKQEIVLTDRYSDLEMMRLHASSDCGVFPSYGEAWCLPAFDSMAMGKTPIVPEWGGFLEYMGRKQEFGWTVCGHEEPVTGTQQDTFPDLHTAREDWFSVDIEDLRLCMRKAYTLNEARKRRSLAGVTRAYDFTHLKVGELMKEFLEK
jgi:glycosyltransferase involved in cell wall biosynthesis